MAKAKNTTSGSGAAKSAVKRRSRSVAGSQIGDAMPGSSQDVKRRLGNFGSAGEHPRVGGRTSGIVGQTTKRGKTDKRVKK